MEERIPEKLRSIDLKLLTDIIRQDKNNSLFEITNWNVKRLSNKGIANPDGLWLLTGDGSDGIGSCPWSIVLKILERPEQDVPASDLWYWKREVLLIQSGLLEQLPKMVKAPRYYRVEETFSGAWLWQEYIENSRPNSWTLHDYAFAAHQLGLWNGTYLCGTPLPEEPWFTQKHYRSWCTETNPNLDFQFLLNQKYIVGEIRKRYERLWEERELFYSTLESLPRIFSHFDSQQRNLIIRQSSNHQDELVLLDWALCGFGPLGAELFSLIGMSAGLLEWSPTAIKELDEIAFGSYLQGLAETGWSGNTDMIRLAYTAWMTVWFGVTFPNIAALWCTPDSRPFALQQFGFAEEELYQKWPPLFNYSLDCADEARSLMTKLGYW